MTSRNRSRPLSLLLAAALALLAAAPAAPPVREVARVGFTVADAGRAADFYAKVLDFEKVSDVEVSGPAYERLFRVKGLRARVVRMRLGREEIELTQFLQRPGRPFPAGSRANDRWFQHVAIVVSDMGRAYARLEAAHAQRASAAPQRLPDWNPNAAGIEAYYFRDPDGRFLEIIRFPPGKGEVRWQDAGGRLFLGIDHTAVVVEDTDRSLRFYRDLLGLRVAGGSENYGPEQEALNAVKGARLRITTLRAAKGPGIELLEYRTPRDGKPRPPDARPNDLLHWQTDLVVAHPGVVESRLMSAGTTFDSPGVVDLPGPRLGFTRAMLVADPDGHRMRVINENKPGEAR